MSSDTNPIQRSNVSGYTSLAAHEKLKIEKTIADIDSRISRLSLIAFAAFITGGSAILTLPTDLSVCVGSAFGGLFLFSIYMISNSQKEKAQLIQKLFVDAKKSIVEELPKGEINPEKGDSA